MSRKTLARPGRRPWTARRALVLGASARQPLVVDAAEVRSGPFELAIEEDGKTRVRERYVGRQPASPARLRRIALSEGDGGRRPGRSVAT
ncbi:MAG: hypothetical protein U5L03_17665 [Burkholderiaceae bacterium]|nr:hypothetical protein [Burkholderiaceae bacterium]